MMQFTRNTFKVEDLKFGDCAIYRETISGGLVMSLIMSISVINKTILLSNRQQIDVADVLSTSMEDWKNIKEKAV